MKRTARLLSRLGLRRNGMISFPKAGRTWLRVMLDELGVRLDYSHAGSDHSKARHFAELDTSEARLYRRIVFLHRDPRDTAVSGYYQMDRRRGGYAGTLSDFLRDPHHGVEKVARFNAMWLAHAETHPNMLVVTYEDVHADGSGILRRILDFLGRRVEPARVAQVVEDHRFERMQARERSGAYSARYGGALTPADVADPDSYKTRRGRVGGYREELSEADLAYCDEVLARFGEAPELKGGVRRA